jgi:hypothetical protein
MVLSFSTTVSAFSLAAVVAGAGIETVRCPLVTPGLADGVGFGVKKRVQRVFYGSSDNLVKVRANLLFIDVDDL